MTPTNIGTPDWQRGLVNAGKLLETVPGNTGSATVTLTPNTRTLVVVLPSSVAGQAVDVQGTTTDMFYPGTVMVNAADATAGEMFAFTVSPETDDVVTVSCYPVPGFTWYVYANNATQVVSIAELSKLMAYAGESGKNFGIPMMGFDGTYADRVRVDTSGRLVPLVPSATSGKIAIPAGQVVIVPAPASGYNYLYGSTLTNSTAAAVSIDIIAGGNDLDYVSVPAGASVTLDLNGYAVNVAVFAQAPVVGVDVVLRYASDV